MHTAGRPFRSIWRQSGHGLSHWFSAFRKGSSPRKETRHTGAVATPSGERIHGGQLVDRGSAARFSGDHETISISVRPRVQGVYGTGPPSLADESSNCSGSTASA